MRAHNVVHVENTTTSSRKPSDIAAPSDPREIPLVTDTGETVFDIEEVLAYRKRGRGYQFLPLPQRVASQDTEWQPKFYFVDEDGTVTAAFLT